MWPTTHQTGTADLILTDPSGAEISIAPPTNVIAAVAWEVEALLVEVDLEVRHRDETAMDAR